MPTYFVLVADLVGSRTVSGRTSHATTLDRFLRRLVRSQPHAWQAPLMSIKGIDELSGALHRAEVVADVVFGLNRTFWPRHYRFALAWGEVDVAGTGRLASAMDGPAFHRASEAIQRAEREKLPFALHDSLDAARPEILRALESVVLLHHAILEDVPPVSFEVALAWLDRESPRMTQAELAAARGVSAQSISKSLVRSHAHELEAAEGALRAALAAISPGLPD